MGPAGGAHRSAGLVRANPLRTACVVRIVLYMETTTAAKFFRLSAIHFAKAAENGPRASYYLALAQGELARAQALEA